MRAIASVTRWKHRQGPDKVSCFSTNQREPSLGDSHGACRIRPFQESDQSAVVAMWKEVFNYSAPHNHPLAIVAHKLAVQRELFWVALLNGRIVGTVMAGYDGHRGWLYSLAVAPDVRRRGIGTTLLKRAEQTLTYLGCPKINLQVVASNAAVVEVYTKLGYAFEDRVSMGKVVRADTP